MSSTGAARRNRWASRRRTALLLAALLACCLSLLAGSSPATVDRGARTPLIVGGETARPGEFPSLVFVAYLIPEEDRATICSGTLVARRLVLTAAHCVDQAGALVLEENFRVIAGQVNWSSPRPRALRVTRSWVFPRYDARDGSGDAGLLQLAEPAPSPPVKLAATRFWSPGTPVVVAGWGKRLRSQRTPTYLLRHASLEVVAPRECRPQRGGWPGQICGRDVRGRRSSPCFGDSGGPLFFRRPRGGRLVQIGLVHGGEYCDPAYPSVYTSTAGFLSRWVRARIGEISRSFGSSAG